MKLSCEIVGDLLPLYQDDLCSPESRQAVEAHLAQCPSCAQKLRLLNLPLEMAAESESIPEGERRSRRVFRKIRRRWALSLLAVLLIFPLLGLGVMGYHQYRGEGICFTNLDDLWTCRRFLYLVEKGRYAEAVERMDFSQTYDDILDVLSWQPEDYEVAFQEITLNGETWMAEPWFGEQYFSGRVDDGTDTDWMYLIYNNVAQVPVPLDVWQRVTDAALETDGTGRQRSILPESGQTYCLLRTKWGDFMVSEDLWETLEQQEQTPADLCSVFTLIPESLYLEAKPALEADALEQYNYNQNRYGPVRDMSREEFCAYMKTELAQSISNAMTGVSFSGVSYKGAYYLDDHWDVEYSLTARNASGEGDRMTFCFSMSPQGIYHISGSFQNENPLIRELLDAFHINTNFGD